MGQLNIMVDVGLNGYTRIKSSALAPATAAAAPSG